MSKRLTVREIVSRLLRKLRNQAPVEPEQVVELTLIGPPAPAEAATPAEAVAPETVDGAEQIEVEVGATGENWVIILGPYGDLTFGPDGTRPPITGGVVVTKTASALEAANLIRTVGIQMEPGEAAISRSSSGEGLTGLWRYALADFQPNFSPSRASNTIHALRDAIRDQNVVRADWVLNRAQGR